MLFMAAELPEDNSVKHAFPLTAVLIAATLLASPAITSAQTPGRTVRGEQPESPALPTLPPQAAARFAAGLAGNLPPGFGGPLPAAQNPPPAIGTPPSGGPAEGRGLPTVCGPGGALSGEATNGMAGRARARALLCPRG